MYHIIFIGILLVVHPVQSGCIYSFTNPFCFSIVHLVAIFVKSFDYPMKMIGITWSPSLPIFLVLTVPIHLTHWVGFCNLDSFHERDNSRIFFNHIFKLLNLVTQLSAYLQRLNLTFCGKLPCTNITLPLFTILVKAKYVKWFICFLPLLIIQE